MRVTFRDPQDPEFWGSKFIGKPVVSVNGEDLHGVIEVDDEEGYAIVLEPIDGRFVAGPEDLIAVRHTGQVKIRGERL